MQLYYVILAMFVGFSVAAPSTEPIANLDEGMRHVRVPVFVTSVVPQETDQKNYDHSRVGCSITLAGYGPSPVAVGAFSAIEAPACLNFEA